MGDYPTPSIFCAVNREFLPVWDGETGRCGSKSHQTSTQTPAGACCDVVLREPNAEHGTPQLSTATCNTRGCERVPATGGQQQLVALPDQSSRASHKSTMLDRR